MANHPFADGILCKMIIFGKTLTRYQNLGPFLMLNVTNCLMKIVYFLLYEKSIFEKPNTKLRPDQPIIW